jgi:outer membrane protein insertion porin family
MTIRPLLNFLLLAIYILFFSSKIALSQEQNIKIEGIKSIEEASVKNIANEYNLEDKSQLNKFVKRLYAKEIFLKLSIEKDKDAFIIKAQENPRISKIFFAGLNKMPEKELKEFLDTKEGSFFTKEKLKLDITKIKASYRQIGYLNTQIESSFVRNQSGEIEISFEVKEGEQSVVKDIEFTGNNNLHGVILFDKIQSRSSFLNPFSSKNFSISTAEEDRQVIIKEYLKRGFADVKVESSIASIDPYTQKAFLTFNITEGEKFTINSIAIENEIESLQSKNIQIINMMPLRIGNIYNKEALDEYIRNLKSFLANFGFISVDVSVDYTKKTKNTLDLVIKIKKNQNSQKFYIRKIN